MTIRTHHARNIRAGIAWGRALAYETLGRFCTRTEAMRWLAVNPADLPQRTIRAARRTYARTLARNTSRPQAIRYTDQKERAA